MSKTDKTKKINEEMDSRTSCGSNKGKRGNAKGKWDFTKSRSYSIPKGENDPEWYGGTDQALKDVTSLSFNSPLGPRIDLGSFPSGTTTTVDSRFGRLPGLMALHYIPTCGISNTAHSAVNIAAQNVYTYVRHMNAGHANYEPADLMMYLLAMDSAYSYYAYLCRLYGVARTYSKLNKFYPKAVIEAMGANFDDIMMHMADFRAQINLFGAKLNSFAVPANIPFMTRHTWMNMHLYGDGDMEKSQTYFFTPDIVWKWSPRTSEKGSQLVSVPIKYLDSDTNSTVAQLMATAGEIVDALRLDEDAGIISGDVLKAFGAGNLIAVNPIGEEFTVAPEYVPEVLEQIMNSVLTGVLGTTELQALTISQEPSIGVKFTFEHDGMYLGFGLNKFLNSYKAEVSPADVAVMSRLIPSITEKYANSKLTETITACGSEIMTYGTAVNIIGNGATNQTKFAYVTDVPLADNANAVMGLANIAMLETFDWHPPVLVTADNTGSKASIANFAYDFQNYVTVSNDWLSTTHEVILQNMWKVPSMGTWTGK